MSNISGVLKSESSNNALIHKSQVAPTANDSQIKTLTEQKENLEKQIEQLKKALIIKIVI